MAKEVKAPQLLGRSDKQGQFRLAPQPKYCPLPFLFYLLPVPSPSSTTERTVLHCTARTLLRDFSLLAVKKEHSCFCWPLFTLSVCVSPFLLMYHCWNTFAHTQQPLLGAAVALGRVLPHWLPSSGKRSPRTVLSNSCWQALRGLQTSLPRRPPQATMSSCWQHSKWWERTKSVPGKFSGFKIWPWLETQKTLMK